MHIVGCLLQYTIIRQSYNAAPYISYCHTSSNISPFLDPVYLYNMNIPENLTF